MGKIKNVTEEEKLHRLAEYDFTVKSKLDCIQYIDGLLESTKSTEEINMLKSISYYLKELNGQFILEPWCVLHDGGEYPYVGQVVCCYNAIGEATTMVYNPDGDSNYEWMYKGQKVLAWCPDPLGKPC